MDTGKVRTKFKQKEQKRREERAEFAASQAARAELLLQEQAGFLEGDEEQEFTGQIKQAAIRRAVDPETAAKSFDLKLQEFGPYRCAYTRSGLVLYRVRPFFVVCFWCLVLVLLVVICLCC